MVPRLKDRLAVSLAAALIATTHPAPASPGHAGVFGDNGAAARMDVMRPRGRTRTVRFETERGTDLAVDISPDGQWIAFDLLGHIYRMPASGGAAECLTQGSGVALNQHPRFSPDGRHIAFVSDRSGQLNVWIMDADGSRPRIVHADAQTRFYDPSWSPDGAAIVAVRGASTPGRAWHRRNASIWRLPLDGSAPEPLLAGDLQQYYAPSLSPDGKWLYFHTARMVYSGLSIAQTGFRIQRLNMGTGAVEELPGRKLLKTDDETAPDAWTANYGVSVAKLPAEFEPRLSPDGRSLAFGRAAPDREMTFRGRRYAPATELVVRDIASGDEQVVAPLITKDLHNVHAIYAEVHLPNFAWAPDSRSLLLTLDGGLARIDVAGGDPTPISFSARVNRVISQRTHGRARIADDQVRIRLLQYPATTRDGRDVAFLAAGRLWISRNGGKPEAVPDTDGKSYQAMPSWSPDGRSIAFASWNNRDRGRIWIFDIASRTLRAITERPGEYLHPVWSVDGASLFYVASAASTEKRDPRTSPWTQQGDWRVMRSRLSGGEAQEIAPLPELRPIANGPDGSIQYAARRDPQAGERLYAPYPDKPALAQQYEIQTIYPDGKGLATTPSLTFPARMSYRANNPSLSPDGQWVAWESDHQLFVERVNDARAQADRTGDHTVDVDPNHSPTARRRIDHDGAATPRWTGPSTLEYSAGDRLIRYDAATGQRRERRIRLTLPRALPSESLALRNATLIAIEPGQPQAARGDVVIKGGRIACVGSCDLRHVGRTIDLEGTWVIPGLIDVHSHIFDEATPMIPLYRPASAAPLAFGVTTAIDPAVTSESLFAISDLVETGRMIGPRSLGTAEVVIDSTTPAGGMSTGMGDVRTISSPADARYQVARRQRWGAVSIKNFRQGRREQHQLLLDAARRAGMPVTGEGGSASFDLSLAMDGQTGWEHALPSLPLYSDVATFMGQAGITYSPTLSIAGHLEGSAAWFRRFADPRSDAVYRRLAPMPPLNAASAGSVGTKSAFSFPILAEGLADIVRAGGHVAVGEHGEQPGIGTHWEMWSYAEAMTSIEVLRAATLEGARFVGLERELGSIRAGKIADLVVLNGDPLSDIRRTADIRYVIKAGTVLRPDLTPVSTTGHLSATLADLQAMLDDTQRR